MKFCFAFVFALVYIPILIPLFTRCAWLDLALFVCNICVFVPFQNDIILIFDCAFQFYHTWCHNFGFNIN